MSRCNKVAKKSGSKKSPPSRERAHTKHKDGTGSKTSSTISSVRIAEETEDVILGFVERFPSQLISLTSESDDPSCDEELREDSSDSEESEGISCKTLKSTSEESSDEESSESGSVYRITDENIPGKLRIASSISSAVQLDGIMGGNKSQAIDSKLPAHDRNYNVGLIRRIIRDDRHQCREGQIAKTADRIEQKKIIAAIVGKNSGERADKQAGKCNATEVGLPREYRLQAGVSKAVRLNVSSDSAGRGGCKLIIVDRCEPLDSLIQTVRNKFSGGSNKKLSDLLILPSRTVLDQDALLNIADGSHVLLTVNNSSEAAATAPGEKHQQTKGAGACTAVSPVGVDSLNPVADVFTIAAPVRSGWQPPHGSQSADDKEGEEGRVQSPRVVGDDIECQRLTEQRRQMLAAPGYEEVKAAREGLPIFKMKDEILRAMESNQVVIISGETGSGKTTQVPAYILEDMIDRGRGGESYIICTQPRRIAAISVAERVAYEHMDRVGETVGYQVRLSNCCSAKTRIVYCTTGVLLRRLQNADFLSCVSHIVVDEVHERQVETDFLMTILKQRTADYPHLRLVMMSATMQEGLFASYFSCPIVYVAGRMFPVEEHYLSDVNKLVAAAQHVVATDRRGKSGDDTSYDPMAPSSGSRRSGASGKGSRKSGLTKQMEAAEINAIRPPKFDTETVAEVVIRIIETHSRRNRAAFMGDISAKSAESRSSGNANNSDDLATTGDCILVFLSGMQAIDRVNRALRQRNMASLNAQVLLLHGSLPPEQQRRVFRRTLPGEWKIVLSTNIAETSVTVDDVTHVVDCGLVKEMRFDPVANTSSLMEVVISKASARQRAGRAGRVRPGHCWRLYTAEFYASAAIEEQPEPEIRRVPLEEVVLQVLLLNLGAPEVFLGQCLEPPSTDQIRASVHLLLDIKAILPESTLPLTALGYHLAKLPVDVRIGKMLIIASILQCLEPALTVAAALSGKSPFSSPPNNRDDANKAHSYFTSSNSFCTLAHQHSATPPESKEYHGTPQNDAFFSDHLAVVNAFNLWMHIKTTRGADAAYQFCRDKYLSYTTLEEMRKLREHFRQYMKEAGFVNNTRQLEGEAEKGDAPAVAEVGDSAVLDEIDVDDDDDNDDDDDEFEEVEGDGQLARQHQPSSAPRSTDTTSSSSLFVFDHALVRSALCAGLYPHIVRAGRFAVSSKEGSGKRGAKSSGEVPIRILQSDGVEVSVHPTSLTTKCVKYVLDAGRVLGQDERRSTSKDAFIVYHKKIATTKLYLHDCTAVSAISILLFGGDFVTSPKRKGKDNDRRGLPTGREVIVTVGSWMQFRMSELHAALFRRIRNEIESLLRAKVEKPGANMAEEQMLIVNIIKLLLS